MKAKLKIGLLLNSPFVPFWFYCMIEVIQKGDFAEISTIIFRETSDNKSMWQRYSEIIKLLPLIVIQKLDKKIFPTKHDAFKLIDISPLVPNAFIIKVKPETKRYFDSINDEDIDKIKDQKLDVIIRGGFKILKGKILSECSKYGIWSHHHGDNKTNRGMPACFWEVTNKVPVCGGIVQILSEKLDNGVVIDRAYIPTIHFSINKTMQGLYWQMYKSIPTRLKNLHEMGWDKFSSDVIEKFNSEINFYIYPLYKSPSFLKGLQAMFKIISRWVIIKYNVYFVFNKPKWIIAYHFGERKNLSLKDFKYLMPGKDSFWADPFIIKYKNETTIFFEEFPNRQNKGHISAINYDPKSKTFSKARIVLSEKIHLSYPFVFEDNDNLYMIPETKEFGSIRLYQYINNSFQFKETLIDGIEAVDNTLIKHNNKWYLFCSVKNHPDAPSINLHIYHSDTLSGEWLPHKGNPIVSDCRTSRPAGSLFSTKSNLYRPIQDCSIRYGYVVRFYRVDELTPETYKEILVDSIEPKWDKKINAIHTYNFCDSLTVVDIHGKF